MKKKLLAVTLLMFSFLLFSSKTFSQIVPGGSDDGTGGGGIDGGGTITGTTTSFTWKRNNGNGWGVCGGNSQIRVVFDPMPASGHIPTLSSIMYNGQNLIPSTVVAAPGVIVNQTQPYVSYCLTGTLVAPGSSSGDIIPANKLTLAFTPN